MAVAHSGNMSNQIQFEEHQGELNAKRVSLVSAATVFAVVNTNAGGNVTVQQGTSPWVNSIPSGVTAYQGTSPWVSSVLGNVTLSDSKAFIGLTTAVIGSNITLNASAAFIGIVTVTNQLPLVASAAFIGIVTQANQPALIAGAAYIGLVTAVLDTSLVLGTGTPQAAFISSASSSMLAVNIRGISGRSINDTSPGDSTPGFVGLGVVSENLIWNGSNWDRVKTASIANATTGLGLLGAGILGFDGTNYQRIATGTDGRMQANVTINNSISIVGNATLSDSKGFIGLVTASAVNVGTNKTLIPLPILFTTGASVATIAVPTNKFKITSILLSSNATVRVNIKSGASYLTGNASLGISLNPGGGFVKMGSPDSPAYFGLANAAGLVIEKFDYSGVISQIGGDVIYFDEA